MENFLISVITVVLNDKSNIETTINSVISQTYSNIEYIIIDGGSNDGTLEIIQKYKNQISIIVSEPDKGIYDAMNKGTLLATGEWISYMNSGDQFNDSNVLNSIFVKNRNVILNKDVIYSDVIADFKPNKQIRKAKNINSFYRGLPFSHQAHLVKTSIVRNRPFNLKYSISADYDLLYSIYKEKAKFYYYEIPIARVDVTMGISKNVKLSILYKDFIEICKTHGSKIQIITIYLIIPVQILYAIMRRFFIKTKK